MPDPDLWAALVMVIVGLFVLVFDIVSGLWSR